MAKYRQIHISFWQDPFIEELSPMGKYFYIYLMTNSKTTQCGCYEISMKLVKYETGLTQKQVNEYIKILCNADKIEFNTDTNEFLILNWLKHNSFKSPKVKACIVNELEHIKFTSFKQYIDGILNGNTPIDRLSKSIDTGSQQEQEQEEEQKQSNRFILPLLKDVKEYCKERGNNIDAESFIDFYSSKGWMIGKNKMKDWKASVRTWEKSNTTIKPTRKLNIVQSDLEEYHA